MTRILVVDDNESGRYLLETLLRSDGYEVSSAASGAEALRLARRERPDLVISDILMPGMDGFTFCRTMKQDAELRDIPVVFYSASYDDERDRRLALAVGAERCITAPLEPAELLRVVRGLADDAIAGRFEPRAPISADDDSYLRAYNDALVRQLERKVVELEDSHARLEQRVRERTAELEASNRELEAFAYSVAHDLRAPLRAIDGYTALLSEDAALPLSAPARRHLERVAENAARMGQIIDDLLMLSRLGRQPLQKRRTALGPLVQSALEDLQPAHQGRHVDLAVAADLPEAWADPSLLRQALFNLLHNALKFTRPRDTARIEIGHLRLDSGETAYFLRDNGVGFDMSHAPMLFVVFQRLHRADQFEGVGAGLAVVSRIIDRHGGRIWAESRPEQGATFYFTLGGQPPPEAETK